MSLDVNITVEGLQGVADAIIKLAGAILAQRVNPAQPVSPISQTEPAHDTLPAQSNEPKIDKAEKADSEPGTSPITRAMVREMFVKAAQHPKVKREELKQLLADCGADSVSTLAEDRFAEVYSVLSHLAKDVQ